MKYFAVLALTLSLVAAQDAPQKCKDMAAAFEACPKKCIDDAAETSAINCKKAGSAIDISCLCKKMEDVQKSAIGCVTKCPGANIVKLLGDAKGVCSCVTSGGKKMKRGPWDVLE